ncbi:MAG: hypothetical protein H6662_02650 [Ardenticatenaceae bacterium]|nr:hypothetical protein [Ardenticatenaceae bacterium]MCB8989414.1 hypothetical protein [Ardenticatenaceae bacterium]MCB9004569.1 hypothetical protein [Ardenticatenaceae bacterium]
MSKPIKLGKFAGLNVRARPSTFGAALALWGLLSLLGVKLFKFSLRKAVWGGATAVLLHFLSELWHQLGHARAANVTGFPMEGIELWGPLAASVYPDNEPPLPADIHIQRALGGPIASVMLTAVSGIIWLLLRPFGDVAAAVAAFCFLDNALVFTLGAFLPLGFTDGSTILHWWPQRNRKQLSISS